MDKRDGIELITGKTDDVMIEIAVQIWNAGAREVLVYALDQKFNPLTDREQDIAFVSWAHGVIDALAGQAFIGPGRQKPPQKGDSPSCES